MKSKQKIQEIIGINLKRERNAKELSQFDLSIETELHRNMIDLIERGKTMPTVYTLLKISEALGIPLEKLLNGVSKYLGNIPHCLKLLFKVEGNVRRIDYPSMFF